MRKKILFTIAGILLVASKIVFAEINILNRSDYKIHIEQPEAILVKQNLDLIFKKTVDNTNINLSLEGDLIIEPRKVISLKKSLKNAIPNKFHGDLGVDTIEFKFKKVKVITGVICTGEDFVSYYGNYVFNREALTDQNKIISLINSYGGDFQVEDSSTIKFDTETFSQGLTIVIDYSESNGLIIDTCNSLNFSI